LAGGGGFGYDAATLESLAEQIAEICAAGIQLAVVVGGGNIWRGVNGAKDGLDRSTADYMGMLATVMNSLALSRAIRHAGRDCLVQSAFPVGTIAPAFDREAALNALHQGQVIVFAGGTGNPYFSSDTCAALRAAETDCEVLLMAKKVDGVYDSDPKLNPNARFYSSLTYQDILQQDLKVMDAAAASLCRDNGIPLVVFNITKPGNIFKAAMGEHIGTIVRGE